jgi:hypothetical protein
MAELITWCRLMRIGPVCAAPCDECRITSGKFARAGITLDPAKFYDAPPGGDRATDSSTAASEVTDD